MTIREKKRLRHRQSIRTVPMSTRLEKALADWFIGHPGGAFTFQAEAHGSIRQTSINALLRWLISHRNRDE